ncbi:MAG: gliding motility-associated protein GldE [Aureispira sp.]|nr:gliding motility-associated protein GldE [Aureispira sp.]
MLITVFSPLILASPLLDVGNLISIGLVGLLLICSGMLSGSEVAYFSITHNDISKLQQDENSPQTRRLLRLLERPRYLLSTILIANNFVNIAIIIVSNYILGQLIPSDTMPHWLHFTITVVLVTFLLVLFGEVAPKVYANLNNMRIATFMSRPLLLFRSLFRPLSWMLVSSTKVIENRLRKRMKSQSMVTPEDITQAIELTVKNTKYAQQDIDILKNIVHFGNIAVNDIMCPRMDVIAVDESISFNELIEVFKEHTFSRIPVYEETLDKVKGVVYSKDLLEYLDQDDSFDWHAVVRPSFFVPENKKIDDLFNDFKSKRTHMAIAVDEYGGTVGIVTLEDVMEEVVGEIQDEFDEPEDSNYQKIDQYTYQFDGKTSINDVCKVIGVDVDFFDEKREGAETIAGLMLILNGTAMPKASTEIVYRNYKLVVVSASKRRIEQIRITLPKDDKAVVSTTTKGN